MRSKITLILISLLILISTFLLLNISLFSRRKIVSPNDNITKIVIHQSFTNASEVVIEQETVLIEFQDILSKYSIGRKSTDSEIEGKVRIEHITIFTGDNMPFSLLISDGYQKIELIEDNEFIYYIINDHDEMLSIQLFELLDKYIIPKVHER